MDHSKAAPEAGVPASPSDEGPKRYIVTIEMTQVFTEEVEIEADTAGQAQVEAEELIAADALGRLEFQDLKSTEYRVSTVWSVS